MIFVATVESSRNALSHSRDHRGNFGGRGALAPSAPSCVRPRSPTDISCYRRCALKPLKITQWEWDRLRTCSSSVFNHHTRPEGGSSEPNEPPWIRRWWLFAFSVWSTECTLCGSRIISEIMTRRNFLFEFEPIEVKLRLFSSWRCGRTFKETTGDFFIHQRFWYLSAGLRQMAALFAPIPSAVSLPIFLELATTCPTLQSHEVTGNYQTICL